MKIVLVVNRYWYNIENEIKWFNKFNQYIFYFYYYFKNGIKINEKNIY